jgi:ribosome maturation factor RimP
MPTARYGPRPSWWLSHSGPQFVGFAFFLSFVSPSLAADNSRPAREIQTITRMHEATRSTPFVDRERLSAVIDPVVRAHGAELVDVELKNENGWILRVYVEKLGASAEKMTTKQAAIDLELCSLIARDLSPALDVADPIAHRYHLEVSSPGVERSLKKAADYVRFAGEKAKLKLKNAIGGQKVLVGTLGAVKDGDVDIVDSGRSYTVPIEDILAGRLVFEFGPASKPQGGKNKKRKS